MAHKTYVEHVADRDKMIAEAKSLLAEIEAAAPTAAYAFQDTNYALRDALTDLRLSAYHAAKKYQPE